MSDERSKELLSAYLDDALDEHAVEELAAAWTKDAALAEWGRRYQLVGSLMRAEGLAGAGLAVAARVRDSLLADGAFEGAAALELPGACAPTPPADATSRRQGAEIIALRPAGATPVPHPGGNADGEPGGASADAAASPESAHPGPSGAGAARTSGVGGRPGLLRALVRPSIGLALAAGVATVAVGVLQIWSQPETRPPLASAAPMSTLNAPLRWNVSQPGVERRLNRYLVNHSEVSRNGTHGMLPYARIVGYEPAASARPRKP